MSIVVIIIIAVPVTLQPRSGNSLIWGMHFLSLLPPNFTILASLVLLGGERGTTGAAAE
jgi:hypothetical protein